MSYNYLYLFYRELQEESELETKCLDEVGRLMFEFVGEPQLLEVHVFTGSKYNGVPKETQGNVFKAINADLYLFILETVV